MNTQDALLVIDAQNGLNNAYHYDELIQKINQLIDSYHDAGKPICFIQHTDDELLYGSEAWQLDSRLHKRPTDQAMLKYHSDSFFETGLEKFLRHRDVRKVEVCGMQAEYCIDTAIRVGHNLGFSMFIRSGLSSTLDSRILPVDKIIAHHENIWRETFATVID